MPQLVADISSYQPYDMGFFNALKAEGVKAVIVKLTEGSANGTAYINPRARYQLANAKAAGLLVHAYHFARFNGNQDARNEADFFVKTAHSMGLGPESVMALDIESQDNAYYATSDCNAFLQYVKDAGYPNVDTYTMASWIWAGRINTQQLISKNLWLANYGVSQPGVNNVGTWQYTSTYPVYGLKIDMSYDFSGFYTNPKVGNAPSQKPAPAKTPAPKPVQPAKSWVDNVGDTWYAEDGKFTLSETINLRWGARPTSSLIATLQPGDVVEYDAFSKHGGYVWLRQKRANGQYGYLVSGETDASGKRINTWGKFSE